MNPIVKEIQSSFPFLKEDDINLLLSISVIREIPAEKILVREGEINTNVFLVLKGLLRSFATTSAGEERTILLTKETMRAASINSFLHNTPSEITIESIEPSVVLVIDSKKFPQLAKANENITKLAIKGMQGFLSETMERLTFFTVLTPEERFINFREKHKDLIQRVPQKYLASFLGITSVSLSRIKARIAKK